MQSFSPYKSLITVLVFTYMDMIHCRAYDYKYAFIFIVCLNINGYLIVKILLRLV